MSLERLLVVAAVLFGAFMVWRLRPSFGGGPGAGAPARGALREAKRRIEVARTPGERALALCDAGDASAASLRANSAVAYYLRAMRTDPTAAQLVERAVKGLSRRPHALESLLWRRLGAEPWAGGSRGAAVTALRSLAHLYEGPLRNRARARALDFALSALGEPPRRAPEADSSTDVLASAGGGTKD
jgi:hypothetical protein